MLVAGVPVLHTGPGGTGAEGGPGRLPCQPLQLCPLLQDGGGCRSGPAHVTSLSLFTLRCPKMCFTQLSRFYQNAPQNADLDLPMSPPSVSSPSGAPDFMFFPFNRICYEHLVLTFLTRLLTILACLYNLVDWLKMLKSSLFLLECFINADCCSVMRDFRMSSVPPQCCFPVVFVEDPCTVVASCIEALQYQHGHDDLSLDCDLQLCPSNVLQLMYACGSSHHPVMVPGNKLYMFVWAADRDSTASNAKGASSKPSLSLPSDASEGVVLTPKNVHALRTLFNIAHRLHHLLGPAWVLVLDILNTLDRTLQSPRTTTQVTFSGGFASSVLLMLCCSCCAAHAVLLMLGCSCSATHAVLLMLRCSCCAAHAALLCTSHAAWLAAACLTVTGGFK